MKVLVTGAAGFIGSHLADALLAAGHEVHGVDNFIGGYRDNVATHPRYHFETRDVCDLDAMTRAADGCDAVYHCAALAYEGLSVFSPALVVNNIVTGSVTVMTAAIRAGVRHVVNMSSMARYGLNATPYRERMPPDPVDPYGLAKTEAERQLTLLGKVHGVKVLHAIPHNVAGPRQRYDDPHRNVASIMVNRMLQGKPPLIYGDGRQVRCFSFIDDVLPVLVKMLDCRADHGEVFNVGPDEEPVTINTLASVLAELIPDAPLPVYYPERPCEVKHAICSSDKIRERFGYETRVSLRDGLAGIVAYVRQRGPRPFRYALPLEIVSERTPQVWKERLL